MGQTRHSEQEQNRKLHQSTIVWTGVGVMSMLLLLLCLLLFPYPRSSTDLMAGDGSRGNGGSGTGTGTGSGSGSGSGIGGDDGSRSGDSRLASGSGTSDSLDSDSTMSDGTGEETDGGPQQDVPESTAGSPNDEAANRTPRSVESQSFSLNSLDPPPVSAPPSASARPSTGRGSGGGGDGGETKFFGVKAKGRKIAYVVDCSGSMGPNSPGGNFHRACQELLESLRGLNSRQHVYVCFFDSIHHPMFSPNGSSNGLIPATPENIKKIEDWVNAFNGGGGTQPIPSMTEVLRMRPSTVFLLTDGQFSPNTPMMIQQMNTGSPGERAVIHTIGFRTFGNDQVLKQIAQDNNGDYKNVQ